MTELSEKLELKKEQVENQTILWIKAEETRDLVSDELTKAGAIVDQCIAYQTVPETEDPTGAAALFEEEGADFVTFTSASTVENFLAMGLTWPEDCQTASIGPITSQALQAKGMEVGVEATRSDLDSLVEAIVSACS